MGLVVVSSALCVVALACGGGSSNTPATAPSASAGYYGQPQQGYPQQGYPQQPATGAYPAQQPAGYPPATGAPAAVAPAAGGAMATPGPLALPCTSDANCGTAKCNVQFSKCAFPCMNSANDCASGSGCNTATGFCIPGQP
ncbi:MAG: hypothetical protein ABI461_15270 [Polyangiaceae bacterium]